MLYATGMTEEDMGKPQIGISSIWYEGNPCNQHLLGPYHLSAPVRMALTGRCDRSRAEDQGGLRVGWDGRIRALHCRS